MRRMHLAMNRHSDPQVIYDTLTLAWWGISKALESTRSKAHVFILLFCKKKRMYVGSLRIWT
jgi:hypothetical protein